MGWAVDERRGDTGDGHACGDGFDDDRSPSATSDDAGVRPRGPLRRFVLFVGRTLYGEWHGIVVDPVRQIVRRGLSGLLLAFVAVFGVIFFHALAQHPTGAVIVRLTGGVKACLPLPLALLRTPVSLYVPALDLPVWAGITQLFFAFALAELALGRARTLVIAYATTLAGTLTVRVMIALGPGWWGSACRPRSGRCSTPDPLPRWWDCSPTSRSSGVPPSCSRSPAARWCGSRSSNPIWQAVST